MFSTPRYVIEQVPIVIVLSDFADANPATRRVRDDIDHRPLEQSNESQNQTQSISPANE